MLKVEASITAKLCAFVRAHHSYYGTNKIYDDYLAYDMIGEDDYNFIKKMIVNVLSDHCWQIPTLQTWNSFLDELISPIILARIKYAESYLKNYAKENKEIQYVICGAGLDSFAFRNSNSNIKIYELDHPNTHNYKIHRIEKLNWNIPINVQYIPIDFEKDNMVDKLLKAGFKKDKKTIFAILGVTYYLELDSLEKTIKYMSQLINNEGIILMDYPVKSLFKEEKARMGIIQEVTKELGEEMKGGMEIYELKNILAKYGFNKFRNQNFEEIQQRFITNNLFTAYKNINFLTAKK